VITRLTETWQAKQRAFAERDFSGVGEWHPRVQNATHQKCDQDGRNLDLPEDAIFHSDRGSNYTSAEFGKELKNLGIRQSGSVSVRLRLLTCQEKMIS
jgi:hypothetical protein